MPLQWLKLFFTSLLICFGNHTRMIVDTKINERSTQFSFLRKFSVHVENDIVSSYSINLLPCMITRRATFLKVRTCKGIRFDCVP